MLQYGSSGAGTLLHLAQIDLYNHVGIEADHVPFDGAARSVPALLGGSVDVVVAHPPELIEHAEAGTVQMLGVFSEERDPQIPDVPTIVEQVGYDTYWDVYKFVMAPAGTPQTIVDDLHDGFEAMLNDEDAANALESLGLAIRYMDGDELGQTLREDNENMGQVIQESGVLEDME